MNKNLIRLLLAPFIILGAIFLLRFMIVAPFFLFLSPLGWIAILIGWALWEKGFFKNFFDSTTKPQAAMQAPFKNKKSKKKRSTPKKQPLRFIVLLYID